MRFIEALWRGDITPGERQYHLPSEYAQSFRIMEECESWLNQNLTPEQLTFFQKYIHAKDNLIDLSECDSFAEGFRFGALMMMDVMEEPLGLYH